MKSAHVVLGNQLLRDHPVINASAGDIAIMIEGHDICSKFKYHKHKLVLVLSAMREYRDYLRKSHVDLRYEEISPSNKFIVSLEKILVAEKITNLKWMRTSDLKPHESLVSLCKKLGITYEISQNLLFVTPAGSFDEWLNTQRQPLMESFYRNQRNRTGLLMEKGKPVGGKWNYDADNQKPLPKSDIAIPQLPTATNTKNTTEVIKEIEELFPDNPGISSNFWLPTNFSMADIWLADFISSKLNKFGDYEDASKDGEAFLFHSVLSPLINIGLLSPQTVIDVAMHAYNVGNVPINSVEGFVRQILGWREYMYGMYRNSPELMDANYFGFTKQLESWWYDESFELQDLPVPVKSVLRTLHAYGYNHHIERLMVLGNWFLLNEYDPKSVYVWFSSMYVDAYEWVMVPNVQGMSQYADGGKIATKPYISGGNYLQKMGSWWPSLELAKQSDYNTLYWKFLYKHRELLKSNFRMNIALKMAEKMQGR